ncbi:asparaginase domain-containing protein [Poseidonibacter ostreae]|jgi:L-asparaginase|uniref:Asparaginase n=1 Tax=Poseidonibacter ostreae TaxID=2654171 RepID=A0A6L4WQN1_9BACT|nr:asparaginase domain-containing protein [Poseidonibacter ostreae]KAB7887197.1 asparaginase [Poseidonibacter ostreae]KAB7888130.1 asparaginase [Poseidonibacter ostreae]MAC83013.1 asparaginase [Arcobacter sp.]
MKVTIINTGGTFNKRYNPIKGQLEVPNDNIALDKILASCFNVDYEVINIVSKDSLDMTDVDRELITNSVKNSKNENIIIIHGTDTVDLTSQFLKKQISDKKIVFTGAMVPMSIDEVEATMNFSQALGFLSANIENGIYLAMHGVVVDASKLVKNRAEGKFLIEE